MRVARLALPLCLAAALPLACATGCNWTPYWFATAGPEGFEPNPVGVRPPIEPGLEGPEGRLGGGGSVFGREVPGSPGGGEGLSEAVGTSLPDLLRVHFPFDSYALDDEARTRLQAGARSLRSAPHRMIRVTIEGHADERGTDEYNLQLGWRRAETVRRYLVDLGVEADRLETISYGENLPLDHGAGEPAWARNRRSELRPEHVPGPLALDER